MVTPPEIDLARVLCRLDELPMDGLPGVSSSAAVDWPLRGFVVRVADGVRAYVNRCAHLQYPLNYSPHQFLTPDGSMILCRVHGALFEKDDRPVRCRAVLRALTDCSAGASCERATYCSPTTPIRRHWRRATPERCCRAMCASEQ